MTRAAWSRHPVAAVLLGIAAWLAFSAWARPLAMPDEGRYAGVALEMLRSGDWLTPTLDGMPFFHKPPLFYWIGAATMALVGAHEWAARMPSLVGGWLGAAAWTLLVRRWGSPPAARATLAVLLTMPLAFFGAQFANLDMLVAGCIAACVAAFAHAALLLAEGGPRPARVLALAYALAAAGMLAKGLIGIVLPALTLAVWLLALRRVRVIFALLWPPGLLLLAALAAPWFIAMEQRHPGFADYFFVVQHFKRFAAGGFNNEHPAWFFPAAIMLLALPWTLATPLLLRGALWRDVTARPLRLLAAAMLVVVVGFFSLPRSKLVGYVLPAMPALAFLLAEALRSWRGAEASRHWLRSGAALAGLACLAAVAGLTIAAPRSNRDIATSLRALRAPGEPVLFVDGYFYDVAFYAQLPVPVPVVGRWDDPEIDRRDDWRKELADAAHFAPAVARHALVDEAALRQAACAGRTTWVLAPPGREAQLAALPGARRMADAERAALWRLGPGADGLSPAGCRGTPNAG